MKTVDPDTIHPAFSNYALGAEVPPNARTLHISGQVGIAKDGTLADTARGQMERAFANIEAILKAADMEIENLVKITVYLTRTEDVPIYRDARDVCLKGHRCASTMVVISALAHPDWLVEIEAIAAS